MSVLSRKTGERIRIGDEVVVTVVRMHGDKVRLGIEAPDDVTIHREEVYRRLAREAAGHPEPSAPTAGPTGPSCEGGASLSAGQPGR